MTLDARHGRLSGLPERAILALAAVVVVAAACASIPGRVFPPGNQEVIEASKKGDAKALRALLAVGAPADATDFNEIRPRKALTFAAEIGSVEAVMLLLRHGADPNTRNDFPYRISFHNQSPSRYDDNHKTALMYAAGAGHTGVVRLLLEAGADPGAWTVYGETALMLAAGNGHVDALLALIERGADVGAVTPPREGLPYFGGSALAYALSHALAGKRCAERLGAADLIVAAHERTRKEVRDAPRVLRRAMSCGHPPLVSRLIALGAVRPDSDALLALAPARENRAEVVRLFIQAGADVNVRDRRFWDATPLERAAGMGDRETVALLLEAGANINATNAFGQTALWSAAMNGHADVIALLLARGADPHRVARYSPLSGTKGGTALNAAVERGCMECARVLLRHGADPRVPDASGNTPERALRERGLVP